MSEGLPAWFSTFTFYVLRITFYILAGKKTMTRVKICGITHLEDALVAVEARADMLGFIFYEPSPRYVSPETVRGIVAEIRSQMSDVSSQKSVASSQPLEFMDWELGVGEQETPGGGQRSAVGGPVFVGVFVNAPLETVARTLDFCQLDAAQLHGDEPPEFAAHFAGRAYKALRPASPEEADTLIQKYLPCSPTPLLPCFLLDAYHPTLYGGTGHVADWSLAANFARRYPLLLAGSLTPENVAEAVRVVQPWGVDVSSGVERAKGKKDHAKVRAFVENVKRKM